MNLFDSSFLCLDIGSSAVRGFAHRVRSGHITKSAVAVVQSADSVFAIKSVVDELEKQLGARFDSAYITGNFGNAVFAMKAKDNKWAGEHKITEADLRKQIAQITPPDGFEPMHIIPLRYDTPAAHNLLTPVGSVDRQLISIYAVIFYERARMRKIFSDLRGAHITAETFFDPALLIDAAYRDKKKTEMFVELGAEFTTVSIFTNRGPVFFCKIPLGQNAITEKIADELSLPFADAERIKRRAACVTPQDMDRFTPADTMYDFSRSDVNDILIKMLSEILDEIKKAADADFTKYAPSKIFLYGGGSDIDGIGDLFRDEFGAPVQNIGADAAVRALATYVWNGQAPRIKAYLARRQRWHNFISKLRPNFKKNKKATKRFIPIMPSTQGFDMKSPATYELFRTGSISMIHVDIMDGFFVDKIVSGIDELKFIRAQTDAHLHVHLMTESPVAWANAAAAAGADTIIVSTNTAGVRAALRRIQELGKRNGIALGIESSVDILKPILKEIDEVLVMAVKPGPNGQEFDDTALHKISVLANTRKRYGLKFKISVDGGINPTTAQMCWIAGADFLVSGSYLANASDFPLAVQSLLRE